MTLKILIIGTGGREWKIKHRLREHECTMIDHSIYSNREELIKCIQTKYDICIIGPEKALSLGVVDLLESVGIKCMGPTKQAAKIETNKLFAIRKLNSLSLGKYNPRYYVDEEIIPSRLNKPIVIKPIGLTGGKGVLVEGDDFSEDKRCVMVENYLKLYDNKEERVEGKDNNPNKEKDFIIEEKLIGEEFSLLTFTDGISCLHCPPVQDYKRLYNDNIGPNTGGMGSVCPPLFHIDEDVLIEAKYIQQQIIKSLKGYKGVLYGSFMLTSKGLKVIEFNARFGDPECINILDLLETDFVKIVMWTSGYSSIKPILKFKREVSIVKYLVPIGYPKNPSNNTTLKFSPDLLNKNITINYYGPIEMPGLDGNGEYSQLFEFHGNKSRMLAVHATAKDYEECNKIIEGIITNIRGEFHYRTDIGEITAGYRKCMENGKCYNVDVDGINQTLTNCKEMIESTYNDGVVSKLGDYGGILKFSNTTLLFSIDGVGTKSLLVDQLKGPKGYYNLGRDLVNHCINDIMVHGGIPIAFLDYFAASKVSKDKLYNFIKGVTDACKEQEFPFPLISGETAEMKDVYKHGATDLVGCIIGYKAYELNEIKEDDLIVGLESSGPHTNGYTLIRNIKTKIPDNLKEWIIAPHRNYFDILELHHPMCHITGGGFYDNLPRIVPSCFRCLLNDWEFNDLFKWIQKESGISKKEMYKTFNCGYGMLLFMTKEDYLKDSYELEPFNPKILGKVEKRNKRRHVSII